MLARLFVLGGVVAEAAQLFFDSRQCLLLASREVPPRQALLDFRSRLSSGRPVSRCSSSISLMRLLMTSSWLRSLVFSWFSAASSVVFSFCAASYSACFRAKVFPVYCQQICLFLFFSGVFGCDELQPFPGQLLFAQGAFCFRVGGDVAGDEVQLFRRLPDFLFQSADFRFQTAYLGLRFPGGLLFLA